MKVLQIADYYHSADGHPMNNITERLYKRGYDVKVYTSTLSLTPGGDEDSKDVETLRFKGFKIAGKAIYPGLISKLLFQKKPDVIHSWVMGFFSTLVTGYLKKIKGFPLVVVADYDIAGPCPSLLKKPYFWLYMKFPVLMADVILAFTEQEKETLVNRFGIEREKIEVLPIGIDYEKFSSKPKKDIRKELGLEDKFIVLNVNYVVPKKNLEAIIKAVDLIDYENIIFLHVGDVLDREYKDTLVKLVDDLKLKDRVEFIGKVGRDELYDYYKAADVFVQAGHRESYSIPILEAMASGVPVITTNVGIACTVIEEGKTGFIIDDEKDIADKISLLIADAQLKKEIGINSGRVAKDYDWGRIITKLENVYERVVHDGKI